MPVEVLWFCCQCQGGEQSVAINPGCPECGHWRCQNCHHGDTPYLDNFTSIPSPVILPSPSLNHAIHPSNDAELLSADSELQQDTIPTFLDISELDDLSFAMTNPSTLQHDSSQVSALITSRPHREGNTGKDGRVSKGHGVASRVALTLTSDEVLRRLFTCGFRENPEKFRQYLATCVRFLATEANDHATLKYERKAATFIAEHVSTITWQIQFGETALGDEKVPTSFPRSLSEAIKADSSVGVISQDEFFIQSNFAAVQRFILESSCLQRLIFRLEQFVDDLRDEKEAYTPDGEDRRSHFGNFFRRRCSHIGRIMEPKPRPGTTRIRWSCSCGAQMWDDYSQRCPDDVRLLEARLNRLFRTVPNGHTPSRNSNIAFNPLRLLQVLGNSFRALIGALTRGNARLCDPEDTTPPSSHPAERDANIYLLTCADVGFGLPTLFQKKWNCVENDKEYFQMLRSLYEATGGGWRQWLTFQAVTAIEYVRFHPTITGLASICPDKPAFPPDTRVREYEPCESSLRDNFIFEAWPPRTLLHLYNKRHEIDTHRRIIRRIPRKLNGKLLVDGDDAEVGWGIYLRAGLHWEKFFWTCLVALVLCWIPGLVWWMIRQDVQGGTGIISCLMGFVGFFVAAVTFGRR